MEATAVVIGLWRLSENFAAEYAGGVVREAIAAGFRQFDTAPEYGRGAADAILARLSETERSVIRVTSKLTLPFSTVPNASHVAEVTRRVKVCKLEALLLRAPPGHALNLQAIGVLARAQRDGLIDFGGFSNCSLSQLLLFAAESRQQGLLGPIYVQLPLSYFMSISGPEFDLLVEKFDLLISVYGLHEYSVQHSERETVGKNGDTISIAAMRAACLPAVDRVIVGPTSDRHLTQLRSFFQ